MSLQKELTIQKNKFEVSASKEVKSIMLKAHEELLSKKIGQTSIKVNEVFPDFTLINHKGSQTHLKDKMKDHDFVVLNFYRGGWCPYCNIELKALQKKIPELNKLNTALVAISPETPDNSLKTHQRHALNFDILTDVDSKLANKIGIAFVLPNYLKETYQDLGIDLSKYNANNMDKLPIPATFILNKKREVIFEYIDLDYTRRLEPSKIIETIKEAV